MTRVFVALSLPEMAAQQIMLVQGGVPGARWQTREQLHLTLCFIGEVDGRGAAMLDDALAAVVAPAFTLQLHGVGQFGREHRAARRVTGSVARAAPDNYQPHTLWASVRPNAVLEHLQRKVDTAIRRVGQPRDGHKFMPHVTLARLRNADPGRMIAWLAQHALFTSAEFPVAAFHLYSSRLGGEGSVYTREQSYALETGNGKTDD